MKRKSFVALFLATFFFVFAISLPILVLAQTVDKELPTAESFGLEDASGKSGTYVEVPVNILNVWNGSVQSIRFGVDYDESVLNMTSIRCGDLTFKWTHMRLGKDRHTIILATQNTDDAIPDGSSGSVVLLNFSVIGGDTSPMNMSFIELANLDAEVGRTTPARNGTFTVTSTGGGGYVTTTTTSITPSPSATTTPSPATSITSSPSAIPTTTPSPATSITSSSSAIPTTTPSPATSITSSPSAIPTTTPSPTPATGGFESIFAMTMLAISYLVLKKRRGEK